MVIPFPPQPDIRAMFAARVVALALSNNKPKNNVIPFNPKKGH